MFKNSEVVDQISRLPHVPGVYQFFDAADQLLYIGKAKNLKKRVQSYLKNTDSEWKLINLHQRAAKLDFKITENELQALLLEAKLIQALKPELNILLKDNQPFLYFFFSDEPAKKGKVPKFEIVFDTSAKGEYFGPFINRSLAKKLYELLNKIFGTRICSRKIAKGCLYYHLGQCAGFCLDNFDEASYRKKIKLIKQFFKDGPSAFLKFLQKQIDEFIKQQNFETAAVWTKYQDLLLQAVPDLASINSMSQLLAKQQNSQQLWMFSKAGNFMLVLENQHNHLAKKQIFRLDQFFDLDFDDLMANFYSNHPAPVAIFTNFALTDKELLAQFISSWQSVAIAPEIIDISKLQNKSTFIDLAIEMLNREESLFFNLSKELQKIFATSSLINKIDCFDISHHQDLFIVGSCVRFENGQPNKKMFRHFKIKTTAKPNDYQSLKEIVYRRYLSEQDLPDLVLIDGGKGQLQSVLGLYPGLNFASLAKKEETIFRKVLVDGKPMFEGKKLNLLTYAGLFVTHIRNTAHNFAVNFHRKLKNHEMGS